MINWQILLSLVMMLGGLGSVVYAAGEEGSNVVQSSAPAFLTCPDIGQLVRDPQTNLWGAGPNWKSYTPSFSPQLARFVGAQWEGQQVGNLYCVYQTTDQADFVIKIQFGSLVEEPMTGSWGKNQGGFRNCHSTNVKDCPFQPMPVKDIKNPQQQLDSLQRPPSQEMAF